jgi:hypothetical protein
MAWYTLPEFVRRHVVADVPDEMSLCLACRVTHCSSEEFANCPRRLADTASLKTFRSTNVSHTKSADPT